MLSEELSLDVLWLQWFDKVHKQLSKSFWSILWRKFCWTVRVGMDRNKQVRVIQTMCALENLSSEAAEREHTFTELQ